MNKKKGGGRWIFGIEGVKPSPGAGEGELKPLGHRYEAPGAAKVTLKVDVG